MVSDTFQRKRIAHVLNTVSKDVFSIDCTQAEFDVVIDSISLPPGPARVNAAIQEILHDASRTLENQKLDDFGDEENSVNPVCRSMAVSAGDDEWRVQSQDAVELKGDKCTVKILEKAGGSQLRFEVLNGISQESFYVECTQPEFDAVYNEISLPPGPARVNAAVKEIRTFETRNVIKNISDT